MLTQTGGSSLSIANTGAPYPLSLQGKNTSDGQLTFSEYNKAVTIPAPAPARRRTPRRSSSIPCS